MPNKKSPLENLYGFKKGSKAAKEYFSSIKIPKKNKKLFKILLLVFTGCLIGHFTLIGIKAYKSKKRIEETKEELQVYFNEIMNAKVINSNTGKMFYVKDLLQFIADNLE